MLTVTYLTSAFTNPFLACFFRVSSTTRKHNRNLKPFLPSERPHASFFDTRNRELVQRYDVYAEIKAADPKYCREGTMATKK